ncbi:MAG: thiamine phosphate synthase, partial [Bryobacteraceae bacterium]
MRCYAITEGLGADRALVFVERNLRRGVEMVQIREKQLGAAELERLVRRVMEMRGDLPIKILVNGTVSYGADGVHLPGGGGFPPPPNLRKGGETPPHARTSLATR